jgi:hypothetical protein
MEQPRHSKLAIIMTAPIAAKVEIMIIERNNRSRMMASRALPRAHARVQAIKFFQDAGYLHPFAAAWKWPRWLPLRSA